MGQKLSCKLLFIIFTEWRILHILYFTR